MKITKTAIDGVVIIEPQVLEDEPVNAVGIKVDAVVVFCRVHIVAFYLSIKNLTPIDNGQSSGPRFSLKSPIIEQLVYNSRRRQPTPNDVA